MYKSLILRVMVCLVFMSCCWRASADSYTDYWPTWRGPQNTGSALRGDPPLTWSETENIKWKVAVPGRSLSSPIVWAHQIIYLTAIKAGDSEVHRFDIVCLDRNTGKALWQRTARQEIPHEGHQNTASFASYSPVTDGKNIWASFGSRGLHCYDMEGNLRWSKDLVKMNIRNAFGEGSSPALTEEAVIVVCDHQGDSAIFAFNKNTGDLLWQKQRNEQSSWTTPVVVNVNGQHQVIVSGKNASIGYDASSGEVIWQCTGMTENVIPTPVLGADTVYLISGFRGSKLQAVTLGKTGILNETNGIAWESSDGTPYVPSPVLMGQRLFFCADGRNKGIVSCYDTNTGKPLYSKQNLEGIDSIYASLVGVGDRVYVVGRNGTTMVLKNADTFEVLATNKLDDGIDASPAIVGNELYLKGMKYLYCIAKP